MRSDHGVILADFCVLGHANIDTPSSQHFQGLRRAQQKAEATDTTKSEAAARNIDPSVDPITRRPGPGRGRPRKQPGLPMDPPQLGPKQPTQLQIQSQPGQLEPQPQVPSQPDQPLQQPQVPPHSEQPLQQPVVPNHPGQALRQSQVSPQSEEHLRPQSVAAQRDIKDENRKSQVPEPHVQKTPITGHVIDPGSLDPATPFQLPDQSTIEEDLQRKAENPIKQEFSTAHPDIEHDSDDEDDDEDDQEVKRPRLDSPLEESTGERVENNVLSLAEHTGPSNYATVEYDIIYFSRHFDITKNKVNGADLSLKL